MEITVLTLDMSSYFYFYVISFGVRIFENVTNQRKSFYDLKKFLNDLELTWN